MKQGMKKIIISFLTFVLACQAVAAQEFEPRETWPLVYENFQKGAARNVTGVLISDAQFNVSVMDGALLYVNKDNKIMNSDMSKVYTALIGDDLYLNVGGKMYKVLSELNLGCVLSQVLFDKDKASKVDIGYGVSSSTGSSMNLTLLLDGRMDLINKSLEAGEKDKYFSNAIPVKTTRYIYVDHRLIPATKSNIMSCEGVDKKQAKDFFKTEKIKWKETDSLEKIVVFLYGQFNKE